MAGFLIPAGTFILVQSGWYQTPFGETHGKTPSTTPLQITGTRGVLSATNQSVVIPLTEVTESAELRLTSLSSNHTPITVTLRDWNASVVLQIVNFATNGEPQWNELKVRDGLADHGLPSTPTLTVARVSADVEFYLHFVIGDWTIALPSVPPFGALILGYTLGVVLIGTGFGLIESVVRDLRRARL